MELAWAARKLIENNKGLYQLLCNVYPEYTWLPWLFAKSWNTFESLSVQKQFLEWAKEKLNIKEMSDWYKVTEKVHFIYN